MNENQLTRIKGYIQWKIALRYIFETNSILIPVSKNDLKLIFIDNFKDYGSYLMRLMSLMGLSQTEIKMITKSDNLLPNEEYWSLIFDFCCDVLEKLKSMDLAKQTNVTNRSLNVLGLNEDDNTVDIQGVSFTPFKITEKGVNVALKLIEHDDNERRFGQQTEISKVLKRNSTVSLVVSSTALLMLATSLYFSYERLKISEQRLSLMEEKVIEQKTPLVEDKVNEKKPPLVEDKVNEKKPPLVEDKVTEKKLASPIENKIKTNNN